MQILWIILALIVGGLIWYIVFYMRFANRELVNELRKTNIELKHTLKESDRDRVEYEQQNIILKDEISLLYQKNDDLTHVVSELSRYYYHMKKISDKMNDLANDLQQPIEDLDRKMKPFLYEEDDDRNKEFLYKLDENNEEYKGWFF